MKKQFFTTYEVADLCGVAHTTVIRWISDGKLQAYETPGGHRRIPLNHLLVFMKEFNIPIYPKMLSDDISYILIIDDEEHVRNMIVSAFAQFANDIKVRACANGIEALVAVGKSRPDLIIMDIIMPEMNGIQMCSKLKESEDTSSIKIIAMSGEELSEEQKNFLSKNADCFIKKPFSLEFLVKAAQKLLDAAQGR